eukprot:CAMPEP_0205906428 /NCGR_PEP_ID=MMETSP1325-20131115/1947_1 /ASSEMBLY_ACC=CAM_ASM_000708 /TAXON_ID=236786 /ORGANISM="Florenciella sp., Strain RCC1007" /LENGTH=113 /DNA_ID=CAMNT_0053272443 /DNA_START=79 /DNA_END=420 /DNA_ORIENTATION=+
MAGNASSVARSVCLLLSVNPLVRCVALPLASPRRGRRGAASRRWRRKSGDRYTAFWLLRTQQIDRVDLVHRVPGLEVQSGLSRRALAWCPSAAVREAVDVGSTRKLDRGGGSR